MITAVLSLTLSCALASVQPVPAALPLGEFDADLNGTTIHYAVHGQGPVLMILPNSWGLTHQGLRALFRPLEKSFTLVYFDPRGMGGSAPAMQEEDLSMAAVRTDLEALRRHLDLGKVPILGWSNGGINLLHFTAEHPDSVAAAIILHASANFSEEDQQRVERERPEMIRAFANYQAQLSTERLTPEGLRLKHRRFVIETWFPFLFADPGQGRQILPTLYRDTGLSWRHMNYANGPDTPQRDARARLPQIHCPVLLIAGRSDLLPPERLAETHQAIEGSRFVVFEKSGHFAPLEEPQKFEEVVTEFLRGLRR